MAVLSRIQSGSTTIDTAVTTTASVTISSCTMTKSVLYFTTRISNATPVRSLCIGELTSATNIDFAITTLLAGSLVMTIEWELLEFSSGVTVQRGKVTNGATSTAVTLSAVTLSQAFPIISLRNTGGAMGNDDIASADITTTTNMDIILGQAQTNGAVAWQVVDYTGCSVQKVSKSVNAVTDTSTISTITVANSFVLPTASTTVATLFAQDIARVSITDTTTLGYARYSGAGNALSYITYVISFTDGTTTQQDLSAPAIGTTTKSSTISAAGVAQTAVFSGSLLAGLMSANTATDTYGEFAWTTKQTTATNVDSIRAASTVASKICIQVVTWLAELTGTASATSTASGTIKGAGALSGTGSATSTASGTLAGAGALSGTASATSSASGTLSGAGALTGTASATSAASGTLSGAGSLSGTGSATSSASGTLSGAGALAGTSSATTTATGTLAGAGALSGSASATSTASGTLTGFSALSGTASAVFNASGYITGIQQLFSTEDIGGGPPLNGAAHAVFTASGTLSGDGALTGTASAAFTASGSLEGSGALSGSAGAMCSGIGLLIGLGALAGNASATSSASGTLENLGVSATPENANLSTPIYIGIGLSARMDTGASISTRMDTGLTLSTPI